MSDFAKLFDTKFGQVLCVLDMVGEEDGAEITFTCKPANFGLCSTKLHFYGTDEGNETAQRCFDSITEEMALQAIQDLFKLTGECS